LIKYTDVFAIVEEMIVDKLDKGEIQFGIEFFYPEFYLKAKSGIAGHKLPNIIDNERLAIKLYVNCWIYDYYQCYYEHEENHINVDYKRIMYHKKDKFVFEKIEKMLTERGYAILLRHMHLHYNDIDIKGKLMMNPGCGQKLFPVNTIELLKTEDINYGVWREIYISNLAANLVLNFISPSFPFIIDWFYVQNIRKEAFNNAATHLKYEHSVVSKDIMSKLLKMDRMNYENEDREQGPLSHKFHRLSKMMHRDMVYIDSDIKLAKDSICVVLEYVGRTLRDVPRLSVLNENKSLLTSSSFAPLFQSMDLFIKHYFEYMYGVYCLNTKCEMIHGDLHANNMTVYRLFHYNNPDGTPLFYNPYSIYVLDNLVYAFKHTGSYSIIIDFSRSIIGNYARLEHEFSPIYAELFFKDQQLRVIQLIQSQLPDIYEQYGDILLGLIGTNFPLIFKFLSIIDGLSITKNLYGLLSSERIKTKLKVDDSIIAFLKKQTDYVVDYTMILLKNITTGVYKRADEFEWPNLTLIKHIFLPWMKTHDDLKQSIDSENIFKIGDSVEEYGKKYDPEGKKMLVMDIFNHANNIIYDIEDYDSWGPMLSSEDLVKYLAEHGEKDPDYVNWTEFRKRDDSIQTNEIFNSFEPEEAEIVKFEPWMLI
jgi:hypothetical protein